MAAIGLGLCERVYRVAEGECGWALEDYEDGSAGEGVGELLSWGCKERKKERKFSVDGNENVVLYLSSLFF